MHLALMTANETFEKFRSSLIGAPLTHLWRGDGTAIFLEFGKLTRRRRDGSVGNNPFGELSVGLEFDWRIERERSILCGSTGNPELWDCCFSRMHGALATELSLTGIVSELCLELSTGHRVVTCSLYEDGPDWALTDRRGAQDTWLYFEHSHLTVGDGETVT